MRNVGSSNFDDVALKQGIEQGYIVGPRIVPATYAIGATGGHCDRSQHWPPSVTAQTPAVVNGPDELRALVRRLHKYGAEVIKFCGTGGVLSKTDAAGVQQFDLAEMKAIVDEAHMLGLRVAVHAHGTSGIKDALRAGVDTVEHASLADAEAFALAKQHGAYFSMDIYDDDYILAEGEKNGVFKESLEKERAHRTPAAGELPCGTARRGEDDLWHRRRRYPHGDNAKQFAVMVTWGMTPAAGDTGGDRHRRRGAGTPAGCGRHRAGALRRSGGRGGRPA